MIVINPNIRHHFAEKTINKVIEVISAPLAVRDEVKVVVKKWKSLPKEIQVTKKKYITDYRNTAEYNREVYDEEKYKSVREEREYHKSHVNGSSDDNGVIENYGLGFGDSAEGDEGTIL